MIVLRFIGALFLLAAVIALAADVTRARTGAPGPIFTSIAKHWADFAPQSLAAAQAQVQSHIHPLLWDPLIASIIRVPAWISLGGMGLLALYFGRRRRRLEIFSN